MKDIILIPTYNERENIGELIPQVFALVPDCLVMVIDDNSPDGTGLKVSELTAQYPNLSLLLRKEKTGLGAAYKEALLSVVKRNDIRSVITMDADGSHDPRYLSLFLQNINIFDMVIGSRYMKGGSITHWALWRRFLSLCGNSYARVLTGLPIHDLTSGFMCIRKSVLEKISITDISANGYAFLMEFKNACLHQTRKVAEIPIVFEERREGQSKLSSSIIVGGLWTPLKIFFSRFR